MTDTKSPIVDIHTHVYPPSYISLLKSRTAIPYIRSFPPSTSLRLVILPAEDTDSTARGRPVGPAYYDITEKIRFMDEHGIDISVISLANPWLDWLAPPDAVAAAITINDDVHAACTLYPGRLFAFATLPLSAGGVAIVKEIARLKCSRPLMRGVILGTSGLGAGLDDPDLLPVFGALQDSHFPLFLHPHYGLPSAVYGPCAGDYGHVLPLALGFPLETTIAVTRMILAGVFDTLPDLRVILAHAGGTLPFLASRIESCIAHDAFLNGEGSRRQRRKTVTEILRTNIFLDAVVYGEVGLNAAVSASGHDRVIFGTDHPFFPPLDEHVEDDNCDNNAHPKQEPERRKWRSVETNYEAIREALGSGSEAAMALGGNAIRVLNLTM